MAQLTDKDIVELYELGFNSPSVWARRQTLLAACELALKSKGGLDPGARWRIRRFRGGVEVTGEGDDEIEVLGEEVCYVMMIASSALR
jgi:hypothetical protein